jgi:hypothetical protein
MRNSVIQEEEGEDVSWAHQSVKCDLWAGIGLSDSREHSQGL